MMSAEPATEPPRQRRARRARGRAHRRGDRSGPWTRWARRVGVVYDIEGPRVRLGVLWFVVVLGALALGIAAFALVYAAMAGVAGLQTARAWRAETDAPHRVTAGASAAALPLAGAIHTALLGVAVLALVVAAVAEALHRRPRPTAPTVAAGRTIQCALFAGLAAASPVVAYRFEAGAALSLVLLVSAYEVGDYLIGSGSRNRFEGPTAGAIAILVTTFVVAVMEVEPFEGIEAWLFGALTAVLAPVGQMAASLVLPTATADAPALRRLDSLLVLGPVFAWGAGVLAAH